ncbi:MAG: hypothetical protein IT355_06195 [Gemmatimonadaceae bacterium]|nr:hypothetical protein [Gemmatimonadaceae bacterium]
MLRLLTFGGLRVHRDDGDATDLTNQRRRLAVLAVVASEWPRGVTRERLLLLLWPDAEADKGRHALNQIVYNLRRELGQSPIAGMAELSLVPDVMRCDLLEFRDAVSRGDDEAVVSLHQGAFLDGFFVPGAGEFDRWADAERLRTQRQVISALDRLAARAATAGDIDAQLRWTERLVELDPLSASRALAHMQALVKHGDRDAAVAYGRRYAALAQADGDEADPAVAAEVERLRRLPALVRAPAAPQPAIEAPAGGPAPAPDVMPSIRPTASTVTDVAVTAALPRRAGLPRRWAAGAAALAVAACAAWLAPAPRGTLPLRRGDRIVIADVQVPVADSASARALAVALQSALQQSARVNAVSPKSVAETLRRMGQQVTAPLTDATAGEVAERESARYVVSLGVTPAAATRIVTLRVLEPSSGSVLRSYATTVAPQALLEAIDEVAGRLRRDLGDTREDVAAAIPLPRATTPSLEALRLYAGANAAANRALYRDASTLYDGALVLDSGFAAARAGLANVAYIFNDVREGDAHMARALALASRLPPRERLLIEATSARGNGDWLRAASLHRAYLIRYPDDYDIYAMLGYDLMRAGESREALAAFDTLRAHRTLGASDHFNVAAIHVGLGEYASARAAHVAALDRDTAFLQRAMQNEQVGRVLLLLGHSDSARVVHEAIAIRTGPEQARGLRALAYVDLYEGRYASAVARLGRAIEIDAAEPTSRLSEVRDRALLASTLLDLGRRDEARAQLVVASRLGRASRLPPQALYWTGKPLLRLGEVALARPLLDSAKARTRASDRAEQAATLALEAELLAAQGRARDAIPLANRAESQGDGIADLVDTRAHVLEESGALPEALAARRALQDVVRGAVELEGQQKARLAPLAMARITARLGRPDEALRTIGAFAERWPTADANLPMLTVLRAQIVSRRAEPRPARHAVLSP